MAPYRSPDAGRLAALLLLLFGQPLSKIARITRDQITGQPGNTQLTLGDTPVQVPPPLDLLLHQLAANRHGHAALAHTDDHPWLFPGGAPGLPLTAHHLMLRLQKFDIRARPVRNTTMLDRAGAPTAPYAADVARRSESGAP